MAHPHSPEPTGRPTSPRIHGLDIARAVILIALGLVLASLQSEVMVVLVPMGAMFLVVLPLVTARTSTWRGTTGWAA